MSPSYPKESARKIVGLSLIIVEITISSLSWSLPWRASSCFWLPEATGSKSSLGECARSKQERKEKRSMSHMSVPATPTLAPVRGCEEAGAWGDASIGVHSYGHLCQSNCSSWLGWKEPLPSPREWRKDDSSEWGTCNLPLVNSAGLFL